MNTVRLSITLPVDIARQLDELVEPKKKSRFITETLRERLDNIRMQQLHSILTEGYQACGQEGLRLTEGFKFADVEG